MRVIWVYGPAGVGKSTTSWELYSQLETVGVRTGYVDIDQLGMCYPARVEDPYREELKAANIGSVLRNFAAAGGQLMIVSGILDPRLVPAYHEGAVGCRIVFCRLPAAGCGLTGWSCSAVSKSAAVARNRGRTSSARLTSSIRSTWVTR